MAIDVEIIPKPPSKKPSVNNYALVCSMVLLLIAGGIYFWLVRAIESANKTISDTNQAIQAEKTSERISLENDLLLNKRRIDDFGLIIKAHQLDSNFLKYLEGVTHPKVFFTGANMDFEKHSVTLNGLTDSFYILGQQLIVLDNAKELSGVSMTSVGLTKSGLVEFTVDLSFDPSILKQY